MPQCRNRIRQRGARLDGIRDEPVVDDIEPRDVRRRFERRLGPCGVAEMPLIDRVVRRHVVDLRRARALRLRRVNDRGQHTVLDLDLFRGVARLRERVRNHDRDRIADMAGLAVGERRMRRHLHRRAVLGMGRPAADEIADLVGRKLRAGEDGDHAGIPDASLVSIDLIVAWASVNGRNRRRPGRGG